MGAYPASGWRTGDLPPSGDPVGSATATGTVTAGVVTITGLADDTPYYLTDDTNRYLYVIAGADVQRGDVGSGDVSEIAVLTQAEYDALDPVSENTLYVIVG